VNVHIKSSESFGGEGRPIGTESGRVEPLPGNQCHVWHLEGDGEHFLGRRREQAAGYARARTRPPATTGTGGARNSYGRARDEVHLGEIEKIQISVINHPHRGWL
jgi:hypothetical protein